MDRLYSLRKVEVETFYLRRGILASEAKSLVLEVMGAFRILFPKITTVEVSFLGVEDNTMEGDERLRDKEIYNMNLWKEIKVGTFLSDTVVFVVDLDQLT